VDAGGNLRPPWAITGAWKRVDRVALSLPYQRRGRRLYVDSSNLSVYNVRSQIIWLSSPQPPGGLVRFSIVCWGAQKPRVEARLSLSNYHSTRSATPTGGGPLASRGRLITSRRSWLTGHLLLCVFWSLVTWHTALLLLPDLVSGISGLGTGESVVDWPGTVTVWGRCLFRYPPLHLASSRWVGRGRRRGPHSCSPSGSEIFCWLTRPVAQNIVKLESRNC